MIALPPSIAPPAPFPLIVAQASFPAYVAPGVRRADYRLTTSSGPLVVHVIAVDTHDPLVRFGAVLAHDRLISSGETVSSMAVRTGAVAGINADYFDIGNTNQPLNAVVNDGMILRTPSKRAVLAIARDGAIAMGPMAFAGEVTYGANQVPLTGVDRWPPQGGAAFLTPAYGAIAATPNVLVADLTALDATPQGPGTYEVGAIGPAQAGPIAGPALALGPAAQADAPPPTPGETVSLTFDTTPSAAGLVAAVGGGPLLLADGAPANDPDSPAPEERDVRFPLAGAALEPDGTLLLLAVDGRQPTLSIGLTRPEFGALMLGFGAAEGMAFDSGGSATLVGRVLGDAGASVLNDPSDGRERPVADGLFVYSDAPVGVDPHLIVRPAAFTAYRGATVRFAGAVIDDAGHRLRGATVVPLAANPIPGVHRALVRERGGMLTTTVVYRTVDRVGRLTIVPERPNPPPGVALRLDVRALDARGLPIVLGDAAVRWKAGHRRWVGPDFVYDTAGGDATVVAALGGAVATTRVLVGDHAAPIAAFAGADAARWHFRALPAADAGEIGIVPAAAGSAPELALDYDLTGGARAAYADTLLVLPGEPVALALEVDGDGSGVPLRAGFVNRFGEHVALTLAAHVGWRGWRRIVLRLPSSLNPPVRLTALYVVPSLGGAPVRTVGELRFRALTAILPGGS